MNRIDLQKISNEVLLNPEIKELDKKRNKIIAFNSKHILVISCLTVIHSILLLAFSSAEIGHVLTLMCLTGAYLVLANESLGCWEKIL